MQSVRPSVPSAPFLSRLRDAQGAAGSVLCVGLDPDPAQLPSPFGLLPPAEAVYRFCVAITESVRPFAAAFKLNLAFFEALGPEGWRVLAGVVTAIPEDRLVVLDGKRVDIGNTAGHYAHALFDVLGGDAATVAPYMGRDSLVAFLQHPGRCAFVLTATSNPSAAEIQHLVVDGEPLYRRVARLAVRAGHGQPGTAGLVVGATRPAILAELRAAHPGTPFLVPGVGAQGGTPEAVLEANADGPILVNAGRSVLYASGGADFAGAAASEAERLSRLLPFRAG